MHDREIHELLRDAIERRDWAAVEKWHSVLEELSWCVTEPKPPRKKWKVFVAAAVAVAIAVMLLVGFWQRSPGEMSNGEHNMRTIDQHSVGEDVP